MYTAEPEELTLHSSPTVNFVNFQNQVSQYIDQTVLEFRKITRFYALFHMGYFALLAIELLTLLLFFSFFAKSSLLAFCLGAVFLTGFSYFVLRFYFQAKKPEQFLHLKLRFIESCENTLPIKGEASSFLLQSLYQLINTLDGQEHQYYSLSKQFHTLAPLFEKFSLWCHWKDVHQMKESLHDYCIQKHIERVKQFPTDLDVHAALATSYIALYKEYMPKTDSSYTFIAKEYASPSRKEKFKKIAYKAIQEFKILDTYAPNNPWVYTQLAIIYHDLELPEQEIETYETLLQITPQDKELLFRCGVLYFQQGHPAQGLKVYEQLKRLGNDQAEALIRHYIG